MNNKQDIRPISYVKANASKVLSQVAETGRPLYITQNGEAKAVLLDTVSYKRITDTLGLLKLLTQGEIDIQQGRYQEQDEFFTEMQTYFCGEKTNE